MTYAIVGGDVGASTVGAVATGVDGSGNNGTTGLATGVPGAAGVGALGIPGVTTGVAIGLNTVEVGTGLGPGMVTVSPGPPPI